MLSNKAAAKELAWRALILALDAIFTSGEVQTTELRVCLGIEVFRFTSDGQAFASVHLNVSVGEANVTHSLTKEGLRFSILAKTSRKKPQ